MDTQLIIISSILIIFLIVLAGVYSSAEIAYSAANRIRIKNRAEQGDRGAKRALKNIENFDTSLNTVVIANNILYIALTTFVALLFNELFGIIYGPILAIIFTSIIVLLFGEILPKSYGKEHAEDHAIRLATFIQVSIWLFYPITFLFIHINQFFKDKLFKNKNNNHDVEEEILTLIDEQSDQVIDQKEKELVRNALEFNDISVEEIQKPRIDVVAVDVNAKREEILKILKRENFSRIPVYDGSIDKIIGILSEREYYRYVIESKGKAINLKKIVRKPMFIPGTMKIANLLPELQNSKAHMAVVLDEAGGVQGIITLEDILEELVGEIWDEHDDVELTMKKINGNTLLVSGYFDVDDFYERIEKTMPEEIESTTMAGYIQEVIQGIPEHNTEYIVDGMTFIVSKIDGNNIQEIKVILPKK